MGLVTLRIMDKCLGTIKTLVVICGVMMAGVHSSKDQASGLTDSEEYVHSTGGHDTQSLGGTEE